ncbi:MAG: ABC transporter permease [Amaricoccus sp.]|uniref:ABC transporter permease n=2 Tax=Amaricoccus TaxID=56999 RepID=UPI00331471FA
MTSMATSTVAGMTAGVARVGGAGGMASAPAFDDDIAPAPFKAGMVRFRRLRVLFALVAREMATSYGKSYGGYFWAIAQPLGGVFLLAILFSLALRAPPLGTSFLLFYAAGTIPYQLFKITSSAVARSVKSNSGLLTYSVVTTLDAVFAKYVFSVVTMFLIALVLYPTVILFFNVPVNLDLGAIALAFFLSSFLGLGIGTLNCVLFGFFPTWNNIWRVLTRPLFFLSGVLFLYESMPPVVQNVLWYNPVVHVLSLMRSGFYSEYDPQFISYPYVIGIALGSFALGGYLLRRHSARLIEG